MTGQTAGHEKYAFILWPREPLMLDSRRSKQLVPLKSMESYFTYPRNVLLC